MLVEITPSVPIIFLHLSHKNKDFQRNYDHFSKTSVRTFLKHLVKHCGQVLLQKSMFVLSSKGYSIPFFNEISLSFSLTNWHLK